MQTEVWTYVCKRCNAGWTQEVEEVRRCEWCSRKDEVEVRGHYLQLDLLD